MAWPVSWTGLTMQLIAQLVEQARAGGLAADRRGRAAAAADQAGAGVRAGGRDHRPPRLRQARPGRAATAATPATAPGQDGADRGRPGRDRRARGTGTARSSRRSYEAAAAADRGRRDGALAVREGPDHRGDLPRTWPRSTAPRCRRQTISTITDKVMEGMAEWQNRPLDPVYPVVFIDAINVKIRDGQVANRPIYVALGGHRRGHTATSSGCGPATAARAPSSGCSVLTELKNRGVEDVLHGRLRRAQGPARRGQRPSGRRPIVQTCVVHLLRNSLPLRRPPGLGRRSPRRSSRSTPRRPRPPRWSGSLEFAEAWGEQVPGDRPAVGERLGRVRAVPGLRRRDPQGHLHDQRDRVASTPGSAGRSRPAGTSPTSRPR